MRILELKLAAFGAFEGRVLDFSRVPGALHVIYGPNEAGKSTSLRGVEALLFGFEHTTRDAHLHPTDKLRVGGRLVGDDGKVLEVVRRKKLKASLRDADDNVIDEEHLRRLFRGIDRSLFRALYGLDHVRLREGARALLDAKGGLGESLFEAGLAGAGVAKLSAALRAEAEALWSPTARKRPLAEALKAYAGAKIDERRMATTAAAYQLQEEAIAIARARRDEADALVRELSLEERRLERTVALAPRLKSRREALAERAELGEVALLPEGARAEREAALASRADAALKLEQADVRAAALREQLAALGDPGRPIDDATITDLASAVGSVRRDIRSADALHAERARLEAELGARAPLGAEVDDRATLAAVRDRDAIEASAAAAQGELAALRARRSQLEERLAGGGVDPTVVAELERATESAARVAARAGDAREAERRMTHARTSLARARTQTAGLSGVADERLPLLAVPMEAEVEDWTRELERSDGALAALRVERANLGTRVADLDRDRAVLLAGGDIPTEAALADARGARDAALERALGTRAPADIEAARERIRQADAVADRLRREAVRATRLATLEAEIARIRERLRAIDAEEAAAERVVRTVREACSRRFTDAGVSAPAVENARAWLVNWRACVAEQVAIEEATRIARLQSEEEERAARALAALAGRAACEPLVAELARARAEIEKVREALRQRAADEKALEAARAEEARLAGESAKNERLAVSALERCKALLAPLALSETAPIDLVSARLSVEEDARRRRTRLVQIAAELEAIERAKSSLDALVSRTAASAGLAVEGGEPLLRAEALLGLLEEARRARETRSSLERSLDEQVRRAEEARERLGAADAALAALAARAGVSVGDLPEAERKSARAVELDRIIRSHEETIAALSDGAPFADLEAQLLGADVEVAAERLASIEDERAEAERRKESATQDVHTKVMGLAKFDESHAFGHALLAEQHLARAKPLFERYVRLRLAASLLDKQIASYSRAHQGPVLTRASELFERLTEGSFGGLKVVLDEADRPELVCLRGGDEIGVDALSDGSRDQLYLALRLATIERHASRAEAMPLVLDDVLVHFDDSRSRAALVALAEIAPRVQVLLFTHHARVVELARQAVPEGHLGVIDLGAARASESAEL